MHVRTYRCPYCFAAFKTHPDEGDDVAMAPDCGHRFTLGEAKRGRPDPDPDPAITDDLTDLKNRVEALEMTVTELVDRLATHGILV